MSTFKYDLGSLKNLLGIVADMCIIYKELVHKVNIAVNQICSEGCDDLQNILDLYVLKAHVEGHLS